MSLSYPSLSLSHCNSIVISFFFSQFRLSSVLSARVHRLWGSWLRRIIARSLQCFSFLWVVHTTTCFSVQIVQTFCAISFYLLCCLLTQKHARRCYHSMYGRGGEKKICLFRCIWSFLPEEKLCLCFSLLPRLYIYLYIYIVWMSGAVCVEV